MLKELFKRIYGGGSGLNRSPRKAHEIIDEEILLAMKSINGEFKKDSLLIEIEEERLKIDLELSIFLKNYEDGEISNSVVDETVNKLTQKYQDLESKVDELNDIRAEIKGLDSKSKEKEKEFEHELKKLKVRSIYEMEKGYY